MKNLTISVFGNQIFSEILKELKLFSDAKIIHYDDLLLCKKEAENKGHLLIYFESLKKQNVDVILGKNSFPIIIVKKSENYTKHFSNDLTATYWSPNIFLTNLEWPAGPETFF